jgi:hypothetical protein
MIEPVVSTSSTGGAESSTGGLVSTSSTGGAP